MIKLSVYDLKPWFQMQIRPLLFPLRRFGITPNAITVAACVLSLTYAMGLLASGFSRSMLLGFPVLVLARMVLNALDGMLSKEFGLQSAKGAFLNEICDVVADVALFVPFCLHPSFSPILMVALMLLGVFSELVALAAHFAGAERSFAGPFGKSDRVVLLSLFAYFVVFNLDSRWLNSLSMVGVVLALLTCWNRMRSVVLGAAK